MSRWYVLDENGEPREEPDFLKAALWYENAERQLADDTIDGVRISTVFLALDHSHDQGPPVLWETMIFGGGHHQSQERYHTRQEALEGHQKWVAYIQSGARPDWEKGFSRN